MRMPWTKPPSPAPFIPHARPMAEVALVADASQDAGAFTCTTCGRSDLPEAGDWDPPICQECDAAINFDAELESGAYGG